jgi:hypothetical protein
MGRIIVGIDARRLFAHGPSADFALALRRAELFFGISSFGGLA